MTEVRGLKYQIRDTKKAFVESITAKLLSWKIDRRPIFIGAFYQGIGFLNLGKGFEIDARKAFGEASRLDTEGHYTQAIAYHLAKVEVSLTERYGERIDPELIEKTQEKCDNLYGCY